MGEYEEAARFDAAQRSPRYAELMAFSPPMAGTHRAQLLLIVLGLALAGMGGFIAFTLRARVDTVAAPALVALGGVWLFVRTLFAAVRLRGAPLERVLARVKDRTTRVHLNSKHNQHGVVLKPREGEPKFYPSDGALADGLANGDVGVAYVRDGTLVDFKPL